MKARDLAKRLIRSLVRRYVYIPKIRHEKDAGPYTRMLGLEDDIEQSAREEWVQHLTLWDLDNPAQRDQIRRIIQSASEEAISDVRRSFGEADGETVRLIDQYTKQFDPEDLLVKPPLVKA